MFIVEDNNNEKLKDFKKGDLNSKTRQKKFLNLVRGLKKIWYRIEGFKIQ